MTSDSPAINYEKFFVPTIGAPLAEDLVRRAALRMGDRVLDVACGTGVVARLASEEIGANGTVVGLDVNPAMIDVARSTTPSDKSIEWHEANAENMPLPDASFDVVLCQMGLQFMPDKHAALREMGRVLVPGGRLVLNLPGPTPQIFAIMAKAFARHVGTEAAGFVSQVFSIHDTAEIRNLLSGAGFRDISVQANTKSLHLPAPEEFLWQYVYSTPLVGVVAKADNDIRDMLERHIVREWKDFVKDRGMLLQVRVVVADVRN